MMMITHFPENPNKFLRATHFDFRQLLPIRSYQRWQETQKSPSIIWVILIYKGNSAWKLFGQKELPLKKSEINSVIAKYNSCSAYLRSILASYPEKPIPHPPSQPEPTFRQVWVTHFLLPPPPSPSPSFPHHHWETWDSVPKKEWEWDSGTRTLSQPGLPHIEICRKTAIYRHKLPKLKNIRSLRFDRPTVIVIIDYFATSVR